MADEEQGLETVLDHIKTLLSEKRVAEANDVIRNPANREAVSEGVLDIVPLVCGFLADGGEPSGELEEHVCACQDVLLSVATVGNPKELMVSLLEQFCLISLDVVFRLLLEPLRIALKRTKRSTQSLSTVLDAVQLRLRALPAPKSYGLEGKARLLLDCDSDAVRIENAVSATVLFCGPFVRDASVWVSAGRSVPELQRDVLAAFLVQVCHPLTSVDLGLVEGSPKGTLRVLAERLVAELSDVVPDFYRFLQSGPGRRAVRAGGRADEEAFAEDGDSALALGTCLYLILVEGVQKTCLPCVYSHKHVLEASLPHAVALLQRPEEHAMQKGLSLVEYLLKFVHDQQLECAFLDLSGIADLSLCFEHVAVYNKSRHARQSAVRLLTLLLDKFDDAGRLRLACKLLNSVGHAGVCGVVILRVKDYVKDCLSDRQSSRTWLLGGEFQKIVCAILALPQGQETDLLDQSERVLAAVNFLRFVLLRDGVLQNATGIWDLIGSVRETFLDPVLAGLELSQAQYQLELKHQLEGPLKGGCSVAVSVEGLPLPAMPREQTLHILRCGLTRLDLMKSIVIRVFEIIDVKL